MTDNATSHGARPGPAAKPAPVRARKPAPILPEDGISGRPLLLSLIILSYFACITIGAVLITNRTVNEWTSRISSQITVQIKPVADRDIGQSIATAKKILENTPGITLVRVQSLKAAAHMLEPWLGAGNILDDLPVPRLILVSIDQQNPPDLAALSRKLARKVPGAVLDNHSQWRSELTRTAAAIRIVAFAILLLVMLTIVSMIIFATRAAMASNRDIVEVLFLIGASETYIARQFQKHFLLLGLKAGLAGALAGSASFLLINMGFGAFGPAPSASSAMSTLLFGPMSLDMTAFVSLFAVPAAAALIGAITSKIAVLRVLSAMN